MPQIQDIAKFLEAFAPLQLAESWDNVGLLVGDSQANVERMMTCLTITPSTAQEAIDRRASLIVAHHPLPFKPLKQLTRDTPEGRLLLDLISARIGIYSPHTAFDSAAEGINQRLAEGLGLSTIQPLVSHEGGMLGSGRFGSLDRGLSIKELALRAKQFLNTSQMQFAGNVAEPIRAVAVACGSAGEFLVPARARGCQCLVTGEARFHTALEAEATGMGLLLVGHYASERFAVESLAAVLGRRFPQLEVWASSEESDPLQWI